MAHYMPVNLGEIPDYYRRFIDPLDIVVFKTAPMDANGYFNFGAVHACGCARWSSAARW